MKPGRCQPLQQRWQATVQAQGNHVAVSSPAQGWSLTFAELEAAASALPPCGAALTAAGKGLDFLLDVLRAWRDDAVLLPLDTGSALPDLGEANWPDHVCHIKTTSGSTGTPRQVWFTADQLAADAAHIVQSMGLRPDWPNVVVIPMAHSYGFSNLVLPLLLYGIPLVLAESPLPEALRVVLASGPAFTLPAVPAMWRAWHAAGLIGPRIQLAISAGAPLPLMLETAVFGASGLKLHNFYGSSECGGIAYDASAVPRPDGHYAGTPLSGVTATVDPASGCLIVGSPAVGLGYAVPDPALQHGVFLTTDHVRLEAGGLWLEGRHTDAINLAGRKISPSVIEDQLLALPGVRHCVVFGIPSRDAARVEEIAACLNLTEGTRLEDIQRASAHHLPATGQPRHWRICQDLEPDARGKISRAFWRERWACLP